MKNGVYFTDSKEQFDEIYKLRYDIYKNELNRDLSSMDHEKKIDYSSRDESCHHICAVENNQLIGTTRILWRAEAPFTVEDEYEYSPSLFKPLVKEENMLIVDRLMIRKEYRKSLYPLYIFQVIAGFVVQNSIHIGFCCCEPHLVNLYKMIGSLKYKENIEYPGAGFMVPLVNVCIDYEYAKKINNPLLPYYEKYKQNQNLANQINELIAQIRSRNLVEIDAKDKWISAQELANLVETEDYSFFNGLTETQIGLVIKKSQLIKLKKGQQLIRKENPARNMYLVISGAFEARDNKTLLNVMKKGEAFGEIAFLLKQRRSADVFAATEEAEVLMLSDSTVSELITKDPDIAAVVFYNLAKIVSIRLVNNQLNSMQEID